MLGVVLCGGQSTRMGSDKGLINTATNTWAQNTANLFLPLALPVVISVNDIQQDAYAKALPDAKLILDDPAFSVRGPLLGVLSVHGQYPKEDLFVLACDMPLMETFLLKELLHAYLQNTGSDAFVFSTKAEPEPLCGIYTSSALAGFLQLYREGRLLKHSMKYLLEQLNTFLIPVPAHNEKYFTNVNAHATLNGL